MPKARIKPQITQSQYGAQMRDGYLLHVEGQIRGRYFLTWEAAQQYADEQGFELFGNRLRKITGGN